MLQLILNLSIPQEFPEPKFIQLDPRHLKFLGSSSPRATNKRETGSGRCQFVSDDAPTGFPLKRVRLPRGLAIWVSHSTTQKSKKGDESYAILTQQSTETISWIKFHQNKQLLPFTNTRIQTQIIILVTHTKISRSQPTAKSWRNIPLCRDEMVTYICT